MDDSLIGLTAHLVLTNANLTAAQLAGARDGIERMQQALDRFDGEVARINGMGLYSQQGKVIQKSQLAETVRAEVEGIYLAETKGLRDHIGQLERAFAKATGTMPSDMRAFEIRQYARGLDAGTLVAFYIGGDAEVQMSLEGSPTPLLIPPELIEETRWQRTLANDPGRAELLRQLKAMLSAYDAFLQAAQAKLGTSSGEAKAANG